MKKVDIIKSRKERLEEKRQEVKNRILKLQSEKGNRQIGLARRPIASIDRLKIGVIGCFDNPISSNIRIANALEKLTEDVEKVVRLDYREILRKNYYQFPLHLHGLSRQSDVIIICKGSGIPKQYISRITNECYIYEWFMDIYSNIDRNLRSYAPLCDWRSCTGYAVAKSWEQELKLPVYHILDGLDPYTYYPTDDKKIYDVTFIGGRDIERTYIRDTLVKAGINTKFFGPGYTKFVYQDEFRTIVNQSKIVLNISRGNFEGYSSLRLWNLLGCQTMVLTKYIPNMTQRMGLINNYHIIEYRNMIDLKHKVNHYLQNEEERNRIAKNGKDFAVNNQTWKHAMKQVINIIRTKPSRRRGGL